MNKCETFSALLAVLLLVMCYMGNNKKTSGGLHLVLSDDCYKKGLAIIQLCDTVYSEEECAKRLKTLRCRSNAVKNRLARETFHPYITELMEEGGNELYEIFGQSDNIALISMFHALVNKNDDLMEFLELVGDIKNKEVNTAISYMLFKHGHGLTDSVFCSNYRSKYHEVPEKYTLWKTEVIDPICLIK